MKAHIVTVINSRTHGLAPMMMGNLSDEGSNHHANSDESLESEDGELYRLEIRNALNLVLIQAKAKEEGRAKLTESVSAVDALVTFEQIAEPKYTSMEDLPKSAPKGKGVGNCEDEETETSQNVPLVTIDVGSFEVLSDHGDEVQDDESTNETTEMMPPLPPGRGLRGQPCNEDHQDEEDPFFDCWDGKQEQSDALQQTDPWARNAPKSEPDVKGCLSVNFPACSESWECTNVCQ